MQEFNQQLVEKFYDPTFRQQLLNSPQNCAQELGYGDVEGIEFIVLENTKEKTYFVLPEISGSIDIEEIQAAGSSAGTAGSVSTTSTAGSICTSFSSAGSLGTAGTSGSL